MEGLFEVDDVVANPHLLIAAREAHGWTQADMAARLTAAAGADPPISQGYVSRVEKGVLTVTGERLELIAGILGFTSDLLAMDAKLWSLGEGCLFHRNRASTKASTLRQLHAQVNLLRLQLHRLAAAAGSDLPQSVSAPTRIGGAVGPESAARSLRVALGLGDGAIESVVAVAESLGAMVIGLSLGGREVDATSLHPPGEPPLFVINTDAPVDRQRFTLAHEIGHTVCVPAPGIDPEEMAQAFAAELLAPAREVRADLKAAPITPARLLQLKAIWRISAAALLRRASDLAVIPESRYRSVNAQMSSLGWRTSEPDPLPADRPRLVPNLVRTAITTLGGPEQAAAAAGTTLDTLRAVFGVQVTSDSQPEGSLH